MSTGKEVVQLAILSGLRFKKQSSTLLTGKKSGGIKIKVYKGKTLVGTITKYANREDVDLTVYDKEIPGGTGKRKNHKTVSTVSDAKKVFKEAFKERK